MQSQRNKFIFYVKSHPDNYYEKRSSVSTYTYHWEIIRHDEWQESLLASIKFDIMNNFGAKVFVPIRGCDIRINDLTLSDICSALFNYIGVSIYRDYRFKYELKYTNPEYKSNCEFYYFNSDKPFYIIE
ncbi:MAG: hypothetical protein K2X69_12315 [Silvanigrellaceae bacterium]|nr:hypothetical protein [Silvanigrellaceae bacterium]